VSRSWAAAGHGCSTTPEAPQLGPGGVDVAQAVSPSSPPSSRIVGERPATEVRVGLWRASLRGAEDMRDCNSPRRAGLLRERSGAQNVISGLMIPSSLLAIMPKARWTSSKAKVWVVIGVGSIRPLDINRIIRVIRSLPPGHRPV
jgi:hypothetical protein